MKIIVITIFTGGSGCTELIGALNNLNLKTGKVKLNLIINGYDDGKSTGLIRDIIPGILGPSDFRKNCQNLLQVDQDIEHENLKYFLNLRLKDFYEYKDLVNYFKYRSKKLLIKFKEIENLNWNKYLKCANTFLIFDKYLKKKSVKQKKIRDIAVGNILFAGLYLQNGNDFNLALEKYLKLFELDNIIHNVNNGENLFLSGISECGNIIRDEASIVNNDKKYKIFDIYLTKKKLDSFQIKKINGLRNFQNKVDYLNKLHVKAKLNKKLEKIIKNTNVIIYGPGTQYSSLYPSYLTSGLSKIIQRSKALKIYIQNIVKDKDIVKENTSSLINKFNYYFNQKKYKNEKSKNKFIDYYFCHQSDQDDINLKGRNKYLFDNLNKSKKYLKFDWEKAQGKHFPNLVLKKIFQLINQSAFEKKFKQYTSLSIIMPCLNESKTLKKVLDHISKFEFNDADLTYEYIVVDGGSTDSSIKIAKKFKNIKLYSLKNKQRGESIKYGIKKSKGDIIAIFPTDNEYEINDLQKLVREVYYKNSRAVYGSRLIKCLDLSKQIKKVYKNNILGYAISKYGGMLISFFTLFFYNRYVSDPLTTLKCFDGEMYKKLNLVSKGVDYDLEQFAKLSNNKIYISEIPVNYNSRSFKEGKKITIIDGFKCIWALLKYKFIKN